MRAFASVICLVTLFAFTSSAQETKKAPTGPVKCYVCNSLNKGQEDCKSSDEKALEPFLKTCPAITEGQLKGRQATMCRKILQEVHDQEGILRECAYTGVDEVDGKRRIGNKGIILYLYQCENENGNPCNSASGLSSLVALGFAFLVAIVAKF